MSAELNIRDKHWLLGILPKSRKLNELEEAILGTSFDQETDEDITLLEKEQKQTKFLKKVCALRLVLFPPEYLLLKLFFDKVYTNNSTSMMKLYYKFLFNRIPLNIFKRNFRDLMKEGSLR